MSAPGQQPAGPLAARLDKMRQGAEAAKKAIGLPAVARDALQAGYEVALLQQSALDALRKRMDEMEARCDG